MTEQTQETTESKKTPEEEGSNKTGEPKED